MENGKWKIGKWGIGNRGGGEWERGRGESGKKSDPNTQPLKPNSFLLE